MIKTELELLPPSPDQDQVQHFDDNHPRLAALLAHQADRQDEDEDEQYAGPQRQMQRQPPQKSWTSVEGENCDTYTLIDLDSTTTDRHSGAADPSDGSRTSNSRQQAPVERPTSTALLPSPPPSPSPPPTMILQAQPRSPDPSPTSTATSPAGQRHLRGHTIETATPTVAPRKSEPESETTTSTTSRDRAHEFNLPSGHLDQLNSLIESVKEGNFNEFKRLMENNCDDATGGLLNCFVNGQTVLHYALLHGRNIKWCKKLIMNGANPNLANQAGWHPIHLAASRCSGDTLTYLIDCLDSVIN